MAYIRKTQDVYFLCWNGEEIDQFDTYKEAKAMRTEYNLAYRGGVSIIKRRVRI